MIVAAGLEVVGIGMIPAFVYILGAPEQVLNSAPIKGLLSILNITDAQDSFYGVSSPDWNSKSTLPQPQVLVMGEATSVLNNVTENEITKAIE